MHNTIKEDVTRRDFLKLGVTITAGVVVPAALSSCGGGEVPKLSSLSLKTPDSTRKNCRL